MRILALIPARGGSKRLPGKNIKLLGGIPLIAWTIKAALNSKCCVDVLVSTDDQETADVSAHYGALVPWLRPPELATDTASSVDVAIHALDAYEEIHGSVDGLMLLQPTSPFRRAETIKRGVILFEESYGTRPIVGVSPALSHPAWCFKQTVDGMEPFLGWDEVKNRSQDLQPAWILNGAFYLISTERLRKNLVFLTPDISPLIMDNSYEAFDIDTEDDFRRCEASLVTYSTVTP
jgi:CMP-N,N'-diacetyllegionaminic acid synthase